LKTIALIPIARTTFDIPFAAEMLQRTRAVLLQNNFSLCGPNELVTDSNQVPQILNQLTATPYDMLILLYCSFADSSMAKQIADTARVPVLLWAFPEEPTGGRLRLNSLCGINLTGHALHRASLEYDYLYTHPEDPAAMLKIQVLANAGHTLRTLQNARIGRFGQHPHGFDSCIPNPDGLLDKLGLEIVQVELQDFFQRVQAVPQTQVAPVYQQLDRELDGLGDLDQQALNGTIRTFLALQETAAEAKMNGMAVRCWPEFFTELGCAACGAMSMMTNNLIPCSCEADINGTVTQLILQTLSGGTAFGTDLVHMDMKAETAVLWHCGLAPLAMADPLVKPRGIVHTNRKLPLLMEFTLKPGTVTLARLSEATTHFELVIGKGEMLRSEKQFSGTSGLIRFDNPIAKVLDTIMIHGLEHHVSLTYGDYTAELAVIARYLKIPTLAL